MFGVLVMHRLRPIRTAMRAMFLVSLLFACFSLLAAAWKPHAEVVLSDMPLERVYVEYGDTLWDIAQDRTAPGEDVRDVIARIKKLNGLRSSAIYEGQILYVPVVARDGRNFSNQLDKSRSSMSK
ncbi:MAG: hypothetical protein BLM47_00325 [Candidatus Reconcilbacillus cellulovorans]|uniref:LysM domain-containing protein n=1 Tax=Candidatus Reconcilbacillus cellulovorans TaxID=1906605 RepID=A0A2A6E3W8_9BACL|nr:MAG: hypothetical protein BLM47_00325 [Candidatus Reconcilbacillus cellulovorans]